MLSPKLKRHLRTSSLVLCALLLSCVSQAERNRPARKARAPRITQLSPASTTLGVGFQVQPNGDSAISISGEGFQLTSRIRFDSRALLTAFGGAFGLTAIVPAEMYKQAATYQVTVENADGQLSNAIPFRVLETAGPAPRITRITPPSTIVGQGFNVQSDGRSAIGVEGENFLPGAVVHFGNRRIFTVFGAATSLSASVDPAEVRDPGIVRISVRNPDGKLSNIVEFRVASR